MAVIAEYGRQVRIDRNRSTERVDDVDLPRRIVDVIVAANHVRDGHLEIVDDDAEVVRRHAVAAHDDQVVELGVADLDVTLDLIVPGDASLRRVLEAEDGCHTRGWRLSGPQIFRSPAAVVARLFAARRLLRAQRIEVRGRHITAVRKTALEHVVEDYLVTVEPLHLIVGSLVVVEAQPRHGIENRLDRLLGGALDVGVLDAQDELSAVMARERPREERGAGAAQVQETGGARREAGANGRHQAKADNASTVSSAAFAPVASADRAWSAVPDSAPRTERASVRACGRASRSVRCGALRLHLR